MSMEQHELRRKHHGGIYQPPVAVFCSPHTLSCSNCAPVQLSPSDVQFEVPDEIGEYV